MNKSALTVIIILNWNGLDLTRQCLNSLKKINKNKIKIIVIDNGSRQNEAVILAKEYKQDIEVHRLKKNTGFTGGVNYGLKAGKKHRPAYYLLLNNDAIVTKDFLDRLIETASSSKRIGIVGSIIYDMSNKDKILYSGATMNWLLARPRRTLDFHRDLRPEKYVSGCSMLIKSEVVEKIGMLDTDFFAYFEDVTFCFRAAKRGYLAVCDTRSIVYHEESSSSGRKSKLYTYLFSRNRILMVKKISPKIATIYYLLFFLGKLIVVLFYFTFTRQFDRAVAYFDGFIDGYSNNLSKKYIS